jgi:hypothetical protein
LLRNGSSNKTCKFQSVAPNFANALNKVHEDVRMVM